MLKLDYIRNISYLVKAFVPSFVVADYIACQFALESNFGQSNLAVSFNNHCGMKSANVRPTTRIMSDNLEFAHYSSVEKCVFDYVLWLAYNQVTQHQLSHLSSFKLKLRSSGYCPEKDYIQKIDSIYSQFTNL